MRSKRKASKFKKIINKLLITITVLLLSVVVFFELTIRDRVELAITAQIKAISYNAVDEVVNKYITEKSYVCDNMVNINYDDGNNVKSITENSKYVNEFKTDISTLSKKSIDHIMNEYGIDVKLGNFTGINIISDLGPVIPIDVDATTTIKCEIKSKFETAGVNQTLHKTLLTVYGDIYVGNPIRIESIKFKTSFQISQTIIVGTIPSYYGSISRY